MKQLTFTGKGKLHWWDEPEPQLLATSDALVRPFAVARCDIETAFFRHRLTPLLKMGVAAHLLAPRLLDDFGNKPLAGPFPVGHECVAQVTAIGEGVHSLSVGDVVVVPFQVSCGQCPLCSRGRTAHCETDRPSPISALGGFVDPAQAWGGALSDSLRIPFADHMLVALPGQLDPIAYASAGDNMVDGYRAVGPQLDNEPEAPVLVVGGKARSVGLYAVAIAVAKGSQEVVYADTDPSRLAVAEALGAKALHASPRQLLRSEKLRNRFPISVEASGQTVGLHLAMAALTVCGTCTIVAFHWGKTTPVPLWDTYARNLNIQTGLVDARTVLPKLLALGKSGTLPARAVVSTVASWSDAPEALLESSSKVVIERAPLAFLAADRASV